MSRTHNPPHPGKTLREDILPAVGLNVTQAAAQLARNSCRIVPCIKWSRGDLSGNGTSIRRVARREKRWPC